MGILLSNTPTPGRGFGNEKLKSLQPEMITLLITGWGSIVLLVPLGLGVNTTAPTTAESYKQYQARSRLNGGSVRHMSIPLMGHMFIVLKCDASPYIACLMSLF